MQPVSQLDQNHPDIVGHGQQHFAEIFRLAFLFGLEMNLADFGDTIHQKRNLFTEHGGKVIIGGQGVLDRVMQKTGDNTGNIETQLSQQTGHLHGMDDVRLT